MDANEISRVLLEGLLELEQSGDLVIIHTAPLKLADSLHSKIIQRWADEFAEAPPHEVIIADGVRHSTQYVQEYFALSYPEALGVVERFVEERRQERTMGELADLVAHQGPQDIAMGAYYCVYLQRGNYYDPGYLAWRSEQLVGRR